MVFHCEGVETAAANFSSGSPWRRLKPHSYSPYRVACKHTNASWSLCCILNKEKHDKLHSGLVQLQPRTEPTLRAQTPPPPPTPSTFSKFAPYQPFSSSSISDWVFSELHCKHHIMPGSRHQTRYSRALVVPLSSPHRCFHSPPSSHRPSPTARQSSQNPPYFRSANGGWEPSGGLQSVTDKRSSFFFLLLPLCPPSAGLVEHKGGGG